MSARTRRFLLTGGLGVAVVAIALLAMSSVYSTASAKSTVRTTTVQLGTVAVTVTATGNVAPAAALSVNFQTGGTLSAITVKPGDQVVAGQALAKIDDAPSQAALASAQAALASAQAGLANVQQPVTALVAAQNRVALASAQQQVVSAQASLNAALQSAQLNAVGYQNTLSQVTAQLNRDTNQLNTDQASCVTPTTTTGGSGGGQSCSSVLLQDQNTLAKDNDSLVNARQQQASGLLKDQQSIVQAQNGLVSAQNNLATTQVSNQAKSVATPASVAQAQSQVAQAQAALLTAQKNEANTTLTAPTGGTVAAVNGVVGQTVSGGGTAAASSSSGSSSGGTGASSGSSSASSAFMTLDDTSALQVVAGFAEADASKIQAGQAASITLNALPNQQISGQVTKVDVTSTVVSNVVTYNVTVALTNPPAGARPGMTANIGVVVTQHDNVLHVPTADVTTRGGVSTVTVMQNGKQVVQTVAVGLVGDQSTEIVSGVSEGETVVQPTVSVGSGTGTGTGTGGAARTGGGGFTGPGGLGGGLGG